MAFTRLIRLLRTFFGRSRSKKLLWGSLSRLLVCSNFLMEGNCWKPHFSWRTLNLFFSLFWPSCTSCAMSFCFWYDGQTQAPWKNVWLGSYQSQMKWMKAYLPMQEFLALRDNLPYVPSRSRQRRFSTHLGQFLAKACWQPWNALFRETSQSNRSHLFMQRRILNGTNSVYFGYDA